MYNHNISIHISSLNEILFSGLSHLQGILHEQTLYHHILSTARKYCQNKHQKTCLNYKIPPPSQKKTQEIFIAKKQKKVLNVKSNQ
jgi:hypothetical protein